MRNASTGHIGPYRNTGWHASTKIASKGACPETVAKSDLYCRLLLLQTVPQALRYSEETWIDSFKINRENFFSNLLIFTQLLQNPTTKRSECMDFECTKTCSSQLPSLFPSFLGSFPPSNSAHYEGHCQEEPLFSTPYYYTFMHCFDRVIHAGLCKWLQLHDTCLSKFPMFCSYRRMHTLLRIVIAQHWESSDINFISHQHVPPRSIVVLLMTVKKLLDGFDEAYTD